MQPFDCMTSLGLDDAHLRPVALPVKGRAKPVQFKIDRSTRVGSAVCIIGWGNSDDLSFNLAKDTQPVAFSVRRTERPDVAKALDLPDSALPGFVIVVPFVAEGPLTLFINAGPTVWHSNITVEDTSPVADSDTIRAIIATLSDVAMGSEDWSARLKLIAQSPPPENDVNGFVDYVYLSQAGGFVAGWALASDEVSVWLEDSHGRCYSLESAYRWRRADLAEANTTLSPSGKKSGFLRWIPAARGAEWFQLCGCGPRGRFSFARMAAKRFRAEVRAMGEALFEVNTPRLDFIQRAHAVDLPLLTAVQKKERQEQARNKPEVRAFGPQPEAPEVSIIIPLYDRFDMVENQLLAFAQDPEIGTEVEVIYVNDDPRFIDAFAGACGPLFDIVGVPFRVVTTGDNRGFSSANNLGAAEALGETLVFMNSDVFPIDPGWAMGLVQALSSSPDIGLVAPRLLFPDGSLQHAGMEPCWREQLGIWTNRHPKMGFDPAFDSSDDLQEVSLLSGACVAIRTADFEAIGGWNTSYFIGDFEDSDMCLALREDGLKLVYCPSISLTHLERQSMPGTGNDTFRERVTLINAALYNKRWHRQLRGLT